MKFKRNDKVMIMGKSIGQNIESTTVGIGDIGIVECETHAYKSTDHVYLVTHPIDGVKHCFRHKDLKLFKERNKITYKLLRKFSYKDIKKAQGSLDCRKFDKEYIKFFEQYKSYVIGFDIHFMDFIECASQTWISFLLKHGFIKEVESKFEPFTLELKIKSKEELLTLWHRLNIEDLDFARAYDINKERDFQFPSRPVDSSFANILWSQVNRACVNRRLSKTGQMID